MKTYEGAMTIKWYKNDGGDRRPLTIDCEDKAALRKELARIKEVFMTKGDDPELPQFRHNLGKLPYSVTFEMSERR